jgi:short-subunit dehydrogenase
LHGDFLATPIERTVDMIQLNITAPTELTYLFGRDMATRGSGRRCPGPVDHRRHGEVVA